VYIGRVIEEAPEQWRWGVLEKDKKKILDHLATIKILKESGLKGSGVIGAYHARRVVPLPLHLMAPGVSLEGTVLTEGALPNTKIA
jgi:hypothetical protein